MLGSQTDSANIDLVKRKRKKKRHLKAKIGQMLLPFR